MTRLSLVLSLLALAVLAGCAVQPPGDPDTRGFLWGLWDGAIAPISFIVSLFKDGYRIYAIPNSGVWYDFGYLIGLTCWAGGSHAARRR
jgi:hypothetical protein